MPISARNHQKGKITGLKLGDVMAHITIKVGQNIGDTVTAVVKATKVMVSKD